MGDVSRLREWMEPCNQTLVSLKEETKCGWQKKGGLKNKQKGKNNKHKLSQQQETEWNGMEKREGIETQQTGKTV